jgi:hypothetical protein
MGEQAQEERIFAGLPAWVPGYLAAWGSKRDPEGKTMRVKTAAALAGTTDSNVRMLRNSNPQFRLLETIARKAGSLWLSSYMEAGIRGIAPQIFHSFQSLVQSENPQVVLQAMKWALDKPDAIDITSGGEQLEQNVVVYIPENDRGDTAPDGETN